jgi:hypothetical protein
VFCVAAIHRLLQITYCGQFPNQTEKLSGTDTSRNSPVFSRPGYGSWAVSANRRRGESCTISSERGYGKSVLACALARSEVFARRFSNGVFWIDCSSNEEMQCRKVILWSYSMGWKSWSSRSRFLTLQGLDEC